MKTAEKTKKTEQVANANNNAPRTENRPSLTQKEAKQDEGANSQTPAETAEVKASETTGTSTGNIPAMDNQPAHLEGQATAPGVTTDPVQADQPKAEIKYIMPPRNVEATLKEVDNLHRKGIQRMNLIARKKQLEAFEIALAQEADELTDNPFQGCKLIIRDDKNREFVTTTPGLIRLVAQFIFNACDEKQAEIEAAIVFPNA